MKKYSFPILYNKMNYRNNQINNNLMIKKILMIKLILIKFKTTSNLILKKTNKKIIFKLIFKINSNNKVISNNKIINKINSSIFQYNKIIIKINNIHIIWIKNQKN